MSELKLDSVYIYFLYLTTFRIICQYIIKKRSGIFSLMVDWCSTKITNLFSAKKAKSFFLSLNKTSSKVTNSTFSGLVWLVPYRILYNSNASFLWLKRNRNTLSFYSWLTILIVLLCMNCFSLVYPIFKSLTI